MPMPMAAMPTPTPRATVWSLDGRTAVHQFAGGRCRLDLDRPATGLVVDDSAAHASADRPPDGDRLLGVDFGRIDGAVDHWLRAGDLAAVYEPDDARRLRATAMWRLRPGEAEPHGIACELILSAQTSILESDSGLAVVTEFTAGRVFLGRVKEAHSAAAPAPATAAGSALLWHAADDGGETVPAGVTAVLVYREGRSGPGSLGVVAVHPADVRDIAIERRGGRLRITCWLFTGDLEQTLEKGVLLRGRVFAAVNPLPRAIRPDEMPPAAGIDDPLGRVASAVGRFNASPPPLTT